jgi:thioredoxin-related protein
MGRLAALFLTGVAVLSTACAPGESVFFDGDFASATAEARSRNTMVMLEFYTDWCTWCQRMEKDTLSRSEVRETLAQLVPLKLNAEESGEDLAARYAVDSFPTFVFVDPQGNEIDRVLGYLPPGDFIEAVSRIRTGDTFAACLRELADDPGDVDAMMRAVEGLLERSDPEGAIARIELFHGTGPGHHHELCTQLMFEARAALQSRVYERAAKLYRKGWDGTLEVPDTSGTEHLHVLLEASRSESAAQELAARLRQARYADAGDLLEMLSISRISPDLLWLVADFGYRNGHYDIAADAFRQWYDLEGDGAPPGRLNLAAWQLYLSRRHLPTALDMARQAWARERSPDIADTLARLLYVTGNADEALALQREAVGLAEGAGSAVLRDALETMEAGLALEDRPAFESYPGSRLEAAAESQQASL